MKSKSGFTIPNMQVDSPSLPRLESLLCSSEHFDTERFDTAFRTRKFSGYHSFIAGFSDSIYDERRWLYVAHFKVGMIEKFRNDVIVLFPKVIADEDGHRKVERPIEVRVDGNLGPISIRRLLEKISNELENNTGMIHLARSEHHRAISSIRT
ncbi:MAG: hypothetical protein LVQ95_04350 [Candidatus Micrarchaeales archaeon]|nr:hypothetical protein [Candidatus Micrarchaeales archaeon]